LDPDARALDRARRKGERAGLKVRLDRGFADELPYRDAEFDCVLSSFMFHHLGGSDKARMLGEVRRVLKPGGSLHLLDFWPPEATRQGYFARWVRAGPLFRDNPEARSAALATAAGLEGPRRVSRGAAVLGLLSYACFEATAPPRTPRGVPEDAA